MALGLCTQREVTVSEGQMVFQVVFYGENISFDGNIAVDIPNAMHTSGCYIDMQRGGFDVRL